MGKKKYVAYVGTYTHGTSKGIQVYDVDVENGTLTERSEVEVSNASHLAVSKNGKYLYSIEDEGVAVFRRDKNGDLSRINSVDINGMRGCYLATDVDGRYLYVAGYHDGKVTVVHTHKDGRLGSVMDGVFHKGLGSVAERNFRPHVNCVRSAMRLRYTAMTEAARTRNSSFFRASLLLEKRTQMMQSIMPHLVYPCLQTVNIFSVQQQARILSQCMQ